jgi:hypothetical protein
MDDVGARRFAFRDTLLTKCIGECIFEWVGEFKKFKKLMKQWIVREGKKNL